MLNKIASSSERSLSRGGNARQRKFRISSRSVRGTYAYLDHTCLLSLKWTLSMIAVFDAGSAISALFTEEMELSASVSSGTYSTNFA